MQQGHIESTSNAKFLDIAIGLSNSMQKPWLKNGLIRTEYGKSQTKKSRSERYETIMQSFVVKKSHQLVGKHILCVEKG